MSTEPTDASGDPTEAKLVLIAQRLLAGPPNLTEATFKHLPDDYQRRLRELMHALHNVR